jgi:hypothetical protein
MQEQGAELDSSVEFTPELLSDRLSKVLLYPRFGATLLMSFALGALLLAAVGLHGVLAQIVSADPRIRRAPCSGSANSRLAGWWYGRADFQF